VLPPELPAAAPPDLDMPGAPLTDRGWRRQAAGLGQVRVRRGPGPRDIVVIHDAARPFASADLVSRTIDAAVESGAALAALAASDTVKLTRPPRTAPSSSNAPWPASAFHLAQTPQAFRADLLAAALEWVARCRRHDEAALAEAAGIPVRIVEGEPPT